MTLAERITKYRIQAGLVQSELAQKVGVAPSTVSSWETGAKQPRYSKMEKLAAVLNTTIPDLMGLTDDPPIEDQNPDVHTANALRYLNNRLIATVSPRYAEADIALSGMEEDDEPLEQVWYVFDGHNTREVTDEEMHTIINRLDWLARILLVPADNPEVSALLNRLPDMDKATQTLLSAAAVGLGK